MGKELFSKKTQFGIRKLSVGVCSVILGMTLLAPQAAFADQQGESSSPADKTQLNESALLTDDKKADNQVTDAAQPEVMNSPNAGTERAAQTETNNRTASDGTVELDDRWTASTPADAAAVEAAKTSSDYLEKEYTVFPTPQKVTYGDGVVALNGTVNLVIGDGIDLYTRNRLKETLQTNNISYTTSTAEDAATTNILLGLSGQDTVASRHQADANIATDLYTKIDAHSVVKPKKTASVSLPTTEILFPLITKLWASILV